MNGIHLQSQNVICGVVCGYLTSNLTSMTLEMRSRSNLMKSEDSPRSYYGGCSHIFMFNSAYLRHNEAFSIHNCHYLLIFMLIKSQIKHIYQNEHLTLF